MEKVYDKQKEIKKEVNRLKKIYKKVSDKKYKNALKLIDNVAFMSVTLSELMKIINENEMICITKNASQEFKKENPAITSYNKMYSNYSKGVQQLNNLLPTEQEEKRTEIETKKDDLIDFISKKNEECR